MADLLMYPQADLPAAYSCQIVTFLRVQWPDGFVDENRLRSWITREKFHPVSFLLVEAGLVISHTQVVWKYLAHAGQTYKVYGLTGVFTFPSFRGQGSGAQVVRAATEYILRSDADVGMFHCAAALVDFYARCGWQPILGAVTWVGARDDPVVSDEQMMMKFLSEKGQRGRETFERIPVFFDEDTTW